MSIRLMPVRANPEHLVDVLPQLSGRMIEKDIEEGRYRDAVSRLVNATVLAARVGASSDSIAALDRAHRKLNRALEDVEYHLATYPSRTPLPHRR